MSWLGIDAGTSSVKALLIDDAQTVLAEASAPLEVQRPQPLWSEQDPADWWSATEDAVAQVRAAAPAAWAGLDGIGLSGQMHGAVLLDAADAVLRPAILWNDGRAGAECVELERRVPDFRARACNRAMPGFTAPKLLWVQRHEPDVFARLGTVLLPKDYIRLCLTGERVGEMSDASGTLWLDIAARDWDDELLAASGLGRRHMPRLVEGSAVSGLLRPALAAAWDLAGRRVVVAGGAGDNAASAVGIGAVAAGAGFLSLGTSGVVFAATDRLRAAPERTLHAFCHALPDRWHVMSVTLSASSSLSWMADALGQTDIDALLSRVAAEAASAEWRRNAPIFLPYLSGERTPHNDPDATGLFAGLRPNHGAEALTYAVLEGVAFSLVDGLDVVREAGVDLRECALVGGGSRSRFWAGMLADVLGLALLRPRGAVLGASLGAARLAMLAGGAGTVTEVCTPPPMEEQVAPAAPDASRAARRTRYHALYRIEAGSRSPANA